MSGIFRVTAPVAVVGAGTLAERYIYRNGTFDADGIDVSHLLDLGFIEAVQSTPEPAAPAGPGADVVPDLADLSIADLRKLAAERGVTVPKAASKAALVEALQAPTGSLEVADLLAQAAARGIEVPEGITDPADLVAILEQ